MLLTITADVAIEPVRAFLGGPMEWFVVLAIVVVLFGAQKLPQLGKGMGEAIGNFKKARKDAESSLEEVDATPKLTATEAQPVAADFEREESQT